MHCTLLMGDVPNARQPCFFSRRLIESWLFNELPVFIRQQIHVEARAWTMNNFVFLRYRLMDEEECEEFTDVYWIKFSSISNARFAKRKLDDYPFLGNLLQVTYAPNFENVQDTVAKLEERRRTVMNRLKTIHKQEDRQERQQGPRDPLLEVFEPESEDRVQEVVPVPVGNRGVYELRPVPQPPQPQPDVRYKAPHEHYGDSSLDATVHAVRQRLDKISSVSVPAVQQVGFGRNVLVIPLLNNGSIHKLLLKRVGLITEEEFDCLEAILTVMPFT